MIKNLKQNKIIWSLITLLTFIAALTGILDNGIYTGLFPLKYIAAQLSQDWLTIGVCVLLTYLIATTRQNDTKKPIIIIGIIGSLAYLYGIFSIERVYNLLYLLYLTIFSMSFFSSIYAISSLEENIIEKIAVKKAVRYATAIFSITIAILFFSLWISALMPLMISRTQIQNLYSIYFLDLAFVMPAFIITAIMLLRKIKLGYILSPALYILGIFVIFPLGLGEFAQPKFGLPIDYSSMVMSFLLTALFISGTWMQIRQINIIEN